MGYLKEQDPNAKSVDLPDSGPEALTLSNITNTFNFNYLFYLTLEIGELVSTEDPSRLYTDLRHIGSGYVINNHNNYYYNDMW